MRLVRPYPPEESLIGYWNVPSAIIAVPEQFPLYIYSELDVKSEITNI
jgi:hypothetical protein